jgi:hypothetical protein
LQYFLICQDLFLSSSHICEIQIKQRLDNWNIQKHIGQHNKGNCSMFYFRLNYIQYICHPEFIIETSRHLNLSPMFIILWGINIIYFHYSIIVIPGMVFFSDSLFSVWKWKWTTLCWGWIQFSQMMYPKQIANTWQNRWDNNNTKIY